MTSSAALTHIRALIEAQALEWSIPKMTTTDFEAASKILRELDRLHDADDVIAPETLYPTATEPNGRGRDEDFSSPPAQIAASAANAPGSSLGSDFRAV